ncbi:unnamed protein product [marine sediment metagenome]|uniref:Uncharacterized protein n=1 Tax=marine sediment metagenome TaxID=412755 RepID=X1CL47_9ZZZZ
MNIHGISIKNKLVKLRPKIPPKEIAFNDTNGNPINKDIRLNTIFGVVIMFIQIASIVNVQWL